MIRRGLRAGQFPERKPAHRRPAKVSEFTDFLQQRWNQGCRNATRLFQEIREKRYADKKSMVARFVSSWRKTGKPISPQLPQRIAPKHAPILATSAADQMSEQQQALFEPIVAQCYLPLNLIPSICGPLVRSILEKKSTLRARKRGRGVHNNNVYTANNVAPVKVILTRAALRVCM
jgi:hypothetical protein